MLRKLGLLATLALCAGCAHFGGTKVPAVLAEMTAATRPGGELAFEYAPDGTLRSIDAEICPCCVPQACREAADRHVPGGRVVGAEKEWNEGRLFWEIVKEQAGRRYEILMNPDGSLAGMEESLLPSELPADALAAAQAAAPGGTFVVAERVTGPESWGGEEFHVKFDVKGEQIRVGVGHGKVVRVVRKVRGEVRAPR